MGRKHKGKRKKSDNSVNNDSVSKAGKFTGEEGSADDELSVSNILKWTNSVLYDDLVYTNEPEELLLKATETVDGNQTQISHSCFTPINPCNVMDQPEFNTSHSIDKTKTEHEVNIDSTNDDIMIYMKTLGQTLLEVKEKVQKLDRLEAKVENFERECAKIWNYIYEHSKKIDDRLQIVEGKSDSVDVTLCELRSRVLVLEEERCKLSDELVYLKSQSLRNNLIFANIPECQKEEEENCEKVLRTFLHEKMNLAKDYITQLQFDRVHRIGHRQDGTTRRLLARFSIFKDREIVRKERRVLDDTEFHLHEQFPREIAEKRRRLWPQLKEAIDTNKRAWMSYDTLYIDGKPFKVPCE